MSDVIHIIPRDETHVVVRGPLNPLLELQDHLTFEVPGSRFIPSVKAGFWDGKIRLFSPYTPVLYKGLIREAATFFRRLGYDVSVDPSLAPRGLSYTGKEAELMEWASSVTSDEFEDREYQLTSFVKAVLRDRCILLSSTSSGKTLMMYRLARFYVEKEGLPALLVTTRTNLVAQMEKDFAQYSPDPISVHTIMAGSEKNVKADYVITTWQSAIRMPPEWFEQFSVVCADEVHNWDAKKLTEIMSRVGTTPYRFGFSGTLKDSKNSELTLVGMFGSIIRVSRTKDRIDAGDTAGLRIIGVQLKWPEADRAKVYRGGVNKHGKPCPMNYRQEMEYIIGSEERQNAIVEYVSRLEGNVMILFNRNDKYGKPLFEKLRDRFGDRAMLVYGETNVAQRELVRVRMAERTDVVALASLGTFSEGFSADDLRHVVLAYPLKSQVRLLQSIGRVLRRAKGKTEGVFHDFTDDMRYKSHENYSWHHFLHRLAIYDEEELAYEVSTVTL